MPPELAPLWQAIEAGKADILRRARALPPDVFAAPRKPGAWSPAQMLHHLAIAEGEVTKQINALQNANGLPLGTPKTPAFVVPLITNLMRWGVPLPAPPHMMPPDAPLSLDETETLWNTHRDFLHARLETLTSADLNAPLGLHPNAGPLNARQTLSLADAHQIYHLRQLPK